MRLTIGSCGLYGEGMASLWCTWKHMRVCYCFSVYVRTGQVEGRDQDGRKSNPPTCFPLPTPAIPLPRNMRARLSWLASCARYPLGPRMRPSMIGRAHTLQPTRAGDNGRGGAIVIF